MDARLTLQWSWTFQPRRSSHDTVTRSTRSSIPQLSSTHTTTLSCAGRCKSADAAAKSSCTSSVPSGDICSEETDPAERERSALFPHRLRRIKGAGLRQHAQFIVVPLAQSPDNRSHGTVTTGLRVAHSLPHAHKASISPARVARPLEVASALCKANGSKPGPQAGIVISSTAL